MCVTARDEIALEIAWSTSISAKRQRQASKGRVCDI